MKPRPKSLNTILERIGTEFSDLRKAKGFETIKDFANHYQLPPIQYWRIEKGKSNLTVKTLLHLLSIHQLTIEEFFCFLNDQSNSDNRITD